MELRCKQVKRTTCQEWQPGTLAVFTHEQSHEVADPSDSLWRNDAELSHVSSKRVHEGSSLPNEKIACPVQCQNGLLFGRLHGNKTHRRPPYCLTNCLCVG